MTHLLVLGTHNHKKRWELELLLDPCGFELRTLAECSQPLTVVEDGETFSDNARRKACQQARHLQLWVLGEDSGLCVDKLEGRPGVHSARYSGPAATDATNNAQLLRELSDVPLPQRSAHYVCHMTLADPDGVVRAEAEGKCHGRIIDAPRGTSGFGYDPLFEVIEYRQTFGELGDAVKSLLSHRGRAMRQMVPQMIHLAERGVWT